MRVVDGLLVRARQVGRVVAAGVADSQQAVLYLRQLARGNRGAPSVPKQRHPRGSVERSRPSPSRTDRTQAAALPVLLIHGYLATRGSLHLLESRLTHQGRVVMTYRLGPVHMGDIHESAGFIARKIESLVAQTGVSKVDVVAHSMGGLVALDYLKRLGGQQRIRRLVLLGTPISGTWSALLGLLTAPLGRASLQLLPGSAFLRELAEMPIPPGPEVVAIAADRDWLAPPRTTVLEGVRHLVVPTGHSGLLVDDGVAQVVYDVLAAPSPGEPPPAIDSAGPDETGNGSLPPPGRPSTDH